MAMAYLVKFGSHKQKSASKHTLKTASNILIKVLLATSGTKYALFTAKNKELTFSDATLMYNIDILEPYGVSIQYVDYTTQHPPLNSEYAS